MFSDELVEILSRDFASRSQWPENFYCGYVKLFLGIFHRACRDLNELRHMVSDIYIIVCSKFIL